MNWKKIEELIKLYLMDELSGQQKEDVEFLLKNNPDADKEFQRQKNIFTILNKNRKKEYDSAALNSSRNDLFRKIRLEKYNQSPFEKIFESLQEYFSLKTAAAAVSIFLLGIFFGNLASTDYERDLFNNVSDRSNLMEDYSNRGYSVSNIHLLGRSVDDGEVEIGFDAVKPVTYKGNMSDNSVRVLLAEALLTAENPGMRIMSAIALADKKKTAAKVDPQIKSALITAIKVDENPSVRREALNALSNLPFDEEIRDVYLYVMSNDSNSGLRVASINLLANLKTNENYIDDEIINELNTIIQRDKNDYLKYKAVSMLKGMN